ncbi:ABC transporter permease [Sporolactobacillus sp. THM7-7]|nr:ABC transporter permease [Sporolactobacillus sp. THM7-7]
MSKFMVLFSQSYLSKLKAKSFLISTAIMLLVIAAVFLWPTVSGWFSSDDETLSVTVLDRTDAKAASLLKSSDRFKFTLFSGSVNQADQKVMNDRADGTLVLAQNNEGGLKAELRTDKAMKLNDQQALQQQLQTADQLFRIQQMNLTQAQAEQILSPHVTFNQTAIGDQSENKTSEEKTTATFISYGIAFFIYLFVLSYLSMISSEIAAEKDSRIMEIIISSSSPAVHLLSRVSGILALAFTQAVVLIGSSLLMAFFFEGGRHWHIVKDTLSTVPASYAIFAILFFVLACILYTLIGAVLGSLVNKVQDVGQAITPVTIILMVGFFVAITGMNNPDAILIQIFSFIPFTASMIMPMRIGATDMGIWQAAISLIVLLGTIVWLFLFSLRFYRGSVLTYTSGSFVKKLKQAMSLSR